MRLLNTEWDRKYSSNYTWTNANLAVKNPQASYANKYFCNYEQQKLHCVESTTPTPPPTNTQ